MPRRSYRTVGSSSTGNSSGRLGSRKTAPSPRPEAVPGGSMILPGCGRYPTNGVSTCGITLCRRAVAKLGQPLFATDLHSCEDWELEVRLYQECRVVALPEVWSHVRWIDDGTRIGRACPGQPRSREQEIGLLRDRLTVIERSIPSGPTHGGSGAVRWRTSDADDHRNWRGSTRRGPERRSRGEARWLSYRKNRISSLTSPCSSASRTGVGRTCWTSAATSATCSATPTRTSIPNATGAST